MRYQSSYFSCGPAAVANALEIYGINAEQSVIESIAGTTPEKGTSEKGLINAIEHWGRGVTRVRGSKAPQVLATLDTLLSDGVPVILCVDEWEHWVTCIGRLGKKYIIADGADVDYVKFLYNDALIKRWARSKRWFYGIGVM